MNQVLPGVGDIIDVRASSLGEIFDDALRWKAKHIDKIRSPEFGRARLGTAVHEATAHYDVMRQVGANASIDEAIDTFIYELGRWDKTQWVDISKAEAEAIGVQLVTKYCQDIAPLFTYDKIEEAVEPQELEMQNGLIIRLTGHIDRRLVGQDGLHRVADIKTGYGIIDADTMKPKTAGHGPQLAVYDALELLESVADGVAFATESIIIGLDTSSGLVGWDTVERPAQMLFGDGSNMGYLEAASEIILRGLFVGNPKSMLCTERYCPIFKDCWYRR